jgi:hypothetical protein
MRKSTAIKQDIKDFEEALGTEGLPKDEEKIIKEELTGFKEELAKALESEKKPSTPKKSTPNKATEKKPTTKKAVAKKPKEKAYIVFEGEKIYEDDKNYCDKLVSAWEKRKTKAKTQAKKRKTKPVTQRVASNIASAVTKGIQTIGNDEIKSNPKKAIGKMERLEKAGKEFLEAYEDIVGDTVTKAEINEEFEGIDKIIEKAKEFSGKKKVETKVDSKPKAKKEEPNLYELKSKAEAISEKVRKKKGDVGSCVMGYKLMVDKKKFIDQPAQGSGTCYAVYEEVKKMLIENGVDSSRITIDTGRMD